MNKEDRAAIMAIFTPVLGEELAGQVTDLRSSNKTVKPFCKYRAGLTLEYFLKSTDPKLSAWEYVNRKANRGNPSQEYAKACLAYDPDTGIFRRRIYTGTGEVGDEVGSLALNGYLTIALGAKSFLAHRLAWFMIYGVWPREAIDHIDRDKTNNRIDNLRECTLAENNWNLGLSTLNKSGSPGVSWDAKRSKWYASIRVGGKTKSLKRHETKEQAIIAYKAAVLEYRGHFLGADYGV